METEAVTRALINHLLGRNSRSREERIESLTLPSRPLSVRLQISSVLENSVRTMAKDMTELILDFFPDRNGKVRAADLKELTTKD